MDIVRTLPSQLNLVSEFILCVLDALQKEGPFPEDDVYQIRLILEEAITNAMRHGNKLNPQLNVDIKIRCHNGRLTMDIKDQGPGFDFKNVPNPTRNERLLLTSGRGVFLIKKYVDEVKFYDHGSGIRLIKTLKRS